MNKREVFAVFLILVFSAGFVLGQGSTEISSVLLKATVSGDDFTSKTINIADAEGGSFELRVVSVPGVSIEEKSFVLGPGEEKLIDIVFDSNGVEVGVHVGFIEIQGPVDSTRLPVIFEVESEDVFFDANIDIPPVYTEIERGSKIVYQVKVFDLTAGGGLQQGLGPETVEIEYTVSDLEGNVLITRSEQLVVNEQSQVTNTISFPEEVEAGNYLLSAVVKYKSSVGVSSQTFTIIEVEARERGSFGIDLSDYGVLIIVGIALLVFFGIIGLFVYLLRERDKVLLELRSYNSKEIREVKDLLKAQLRVVGRRTSVDSGVVKAEVNAKIRKLKKKQESRVLQMKSMKSKGLSAEYMRRKLKQWESKGYNVSPVEYKVKELSHGEMKKILGKWKKKYAKSVKKKEKPKIIKRKKNSKKKR